LNLKVGRGKKPSKNIFAFVVVVVVVEKTKDAIQHRAFATNDNCVL
jgi:hypothetical protein